LDILIRNIFLSETPGEQTPAITKAQIRKRVQNGNRGTANANQGNIQETMWKFYSGDSPGMKVGEHLIKDPIKF
jgi:hypothetical protein